MVYKKMHFNRKQTWFIFESNTILFEVKFEQIHSFQDENGRIDRLICFKECSKNPIMPFIIAFIINVEVLK